MACAAVTVVAFAEGARSVSARGDSANGQLLVAFAVIAAICGGLSWMLYKTDRD